MKKLKLTGLTLLAFVVFSAETCEREMPTPPVYNGASGGTNTGAYNCGAGYTGPKGDPQADSFCMAAYSYRCNGQDAQADANCKIYKQLQADNPGMANCPYCK